jgi:outer membrane protein assembly factor BamB
VAVDGAIAIVASGEALYGLKTADGAGLWQAPSGTLTAPLLAKDGWIIAASSAGLAAYRASDGNKIWSRETGPQHTRPTIEGDTLYVPLDDGRLLALDLATGADRWTHTFAAPPSTAAGGAAPALSEVLAFSDRVFLGSSDKWFYALSAVDGAMAWRQRIGATVRGRPVADASRIFVTSMDNVVRAFDRRSGALLWHPSVPFRPTTGPVLIGTTVVVPGAATEVRGFEAASGKPAGQITLDAPLAIVPAFGESGGAAVMAAVTGSLNEQWTLLLTEAQRTLPIVPLTALPGVTVPIPSAPQKD